MIFYQEKNDDGSYTCYADIPIKSTVIRYRVVTAVCSHPLCECGELNLCFNIQDNPTGIALLATATVSITCTPPGKRAVNYKRTDKNFKAFAQLVAKAMDEADWELLYSIYHNNKESATSECKPEDIDIDFNECNYSYLAVDDGAMVNLNSVFPYSRQLIVEINNCHLLLMPYFCLNPNCRCTEVTIMVLLVKNKRLSKSDIGAFTIDYSRKVCKEQEAVKLNSEYIAPAKLKEALLAAYPDIYEYLKKMHRKLQKIYKISRKKYYLEDNCDAFEPPDNDSGMIEQFKRSGQKIGRNDPCPCGSGKKYKKCCG